MESIEAYRTNHLADGKKQRRRQLQRKETRRKISKVVILINLQFIGLYFILWRCHSWWLSCGCLHSKHKYNIDFRLMLNDKCYWICLRMFLFVETNGIAIVFASDHCWWWGLDDDSVSLLSENDKRIKHKLKIFQRKQLLIDDWLSFQNANQCIRSTIPIVNHRNYNTPQILRNGNPYPVPGTIIDRNRIH